jgi:general secretion pathway protein L
MEPVPPLFGPGKIRTSRDGDRNTLSTLYIRLPSKAAADGAEHWLALPCPFALASHGNVIEREGVAPLSELAGAVAAAQQVVLLLAAGDVSLLRVKTPPLSAAKLRLALPNLVEDQLAADLSECIVVAGALADGLRTAAVVQRGWLDILSKTFTAFGARSLVAVPSQLCLPVQADNVTAAVTGHGVDIDVALRMSEQNGIGVALMSDSPDSPQSAATEVLRTLRAIVPAMPIALYVPQERVADYQEALSAGDAESGQDINVLADHWSRWIGGAGSVSLNLMSGLGASSGPQVNWKPWRWSMALFASILVINALGLNIEWWRMKREAFALRAAMIQTYKATYPKETVILDAVAQMHQKIAAATRDAGQVEPDDFSQMAANFAEVLGAEIKEAKGRKRDDKAGDKADEKAGAAVIDSLEYHERGLLVHLKPDSRISMNNMKIALAARNLALTSPSNGVWQIRSAK